MKKPGRAHGAACLIAIIRICQARLQSAVGDDEADSTACREPEKSLQRPTSNGPLSIGMLCKRKQQYRMLSIAWLHTAQRSLPLVCERSKSHTFTMM
jgi:hypothetical protein